MSSKHIRVKRSFSKKLTRLARAVLKTESVVDLSTVKIKKHNGSFKIPDCANCQDRCCVHKKPGEGISFFLSVTSRPLSTADLGNSSSVDTHSMKKKGKVLPEIDRMPRLKKHNGNCIFYDEQYGLCTQYDLRPTICRRFPYEIDYRKTKSR